MLKGVIFISLLGFLLFCSGSSQELDNHFTVNRVEISPLRAIISAQNTRNILNFILNEYKDNNLIRQNHCVVEQLDPPSLEESGTVRVELS